MVFMSGIVTRSSFKFCSKIVISLFRKRDFESTFPFMSDKYLKSVFELALRVDSVRPPELVTSPLNMARLYDSDSKNGNI